MFCTKVYETDISFVKKSTFAFISTMSMSKLSKVMLLTAAVQLVWLKYYSLTPAEHFDTFAQLKFINTTIIC